MFYCFLCLKYEIYEKNTPDRDTLHQKVTIKLEDAGVKKADFFFDGKALCREHAFEFARD